MSAGKTLTMSLRVLQDTGDPRTQFVRYVLAGGVGFLVDAGSLFVLTEYLNVYYLISAALAFPLGLATLYAISIRWVFDKRRVKHRWLEFGIFSVIGLVGLGLNELGILAFTEVVGFHYLLSKVFTTGLVFIWNFSARKFILFS
jgi:putative flippase GtrA